MDSDFLNTPGNSPNIEQLQYLLDQVGQVQARHQEVTRLSGESFNVFELMGLPAGQVRVHTTFIANLLNPRGSHALGDVFLRLFLALPQVNVALANPAAARVEIVPRALYTDDYQPEGGQLDIIIQPAHGTGGPVIILENRLHGQPQRSQLSRYFNRFGRRCQLYYLTPHGDAPAHEDDRGTYPAIRIENISFAEGILSWLEACKKECVNQFMLLNTIGQYALLVRQAVGKSPRHQLEDKVLNLLRNPGRYTAARQIHAQFNEFHQYQQRAFYQQLLAVRPPQLDIRIEFEYTGRVGRVVFHPAYWRVVSLDLREYDGELLLGLFNRSRFERLPHVILHQLGRLPGVELNSQYQPDNPEFPYIWHPYLPNAEVTDELVANLHNGDTARLIMDRVLEIYLLLEEIPGL